MKFNKQVYILLESLSDKYCRLTQEDFDKITQQWSMPLKITDPYTFKVYQRYEDDASRFYIFRKLKNGLLKEEQRDYEFIYSHNDSKTRKPKYKPCTHTSISYWIDKKDTPTGKDESDESYSSAPWDSYYLHNLDGPAVIYHKGKGVEYFVYGKHYTEEEFKTNKRLNAIRELQKSGGDLEFLKI